MSISAPAISVIIAAYNAAETLPAVISSVQAQSFQDFEIIVIDDCSTDGTIQVVQSFASHDPRIQLVAASSNGGPAAARNLGLDVAKGEFVAIVDADDFILPERFEKMIRAARTQNADIVFDNLFWTDPKTKTAKKIYVPETLNVFGALSLETFLKSHRIIDPVPNLGFLKPLIRRKSIGDLRYDRDLLIGEDAYLIMILMAGGAKAYLLRDACYQYERRAGSISSKQNEASMRSVIVAWERLEKNDRLSVQQQSLVSTLIKDQENRILTRKIVDTFPSVFSFTGLSKVLFDRNAMRWLVLDTGSRVKRILAAKR